MTNFNTKNHSAGLMSQNRGNILMRDRKPGRTMSWAALLFLTAIFGVNGCGDLGNKTAPNDTPVANAGRDQGSIRPGTLITLNGSASSDPDGQPLTYSWSFVSRPPGSAAVLTNPTRVSPTFTPDRVGDYVVRLIVNDGTVNSAPDTVLITSNNVAPVANAGPDQGGIAPGTLITLNGAGSFDGDGDPLTFNWSFVSRPAGSTAVLTGSTAVIADLYRRPRRRLYCATHRQRWHREQRPRHACTSPATMSRRWPTPAPTKAARLRERSSPSMAAAAPMPTGIRSPIVVTLSKPAGSAAVLSSTTSVSPTFTVDRRTATMSCNSS